MNRPQATPSTFSWTFQIPVDVANQGFQIAIFGKNSSGAWVYWNGSSYVAFDTSNETQVMSTAPLLDATPRKGSYTSPVSFAVNLSTSQYLSSGVVVMFIGSNSGIPVAPGGVPQNPTASTNASDTFSLFELTYDVPASSTAAILDIDISNVDQVGFTYTVTSEPAPFPLSQVGSTLSQQAIFAAFARTFPSGNPFNECLVFGMAGSKQVRLVAPQDVLQSIQAPAPPSYLAPTGAPGTSDPFAQNTYFYLVSESSASGETAPNPAGVFGGFLLDENGNPAATGIDIGWQSGGTPVAYVPVNPSATGINIYRATGPALNAGSTVPAAPTSGYVLLTSMTIADWNAQSGFVFLDDSASSTNTQAPRSSSYGFSALATWFDQPLQAFFLHYGANTFVLYQYNQGGGGSNGTLWTGTVVDVTPKKGDPITTLQYVDQNGRSQPVTATWQWGDGTQTYKVLQLVGNAYDPSDFTNTNLAGASLTPGEFQGDVVNIYFPYFVDGTGLGSITLPGGASYTLPGAPPWMNNGGYGPSQMVFGCTGVFATGNDPDALAQDSSQILAANALTNLENVIVSALNRGVATGYGFALRPQQYTSPISLSQAPTSAARAGAVPAGAYTYSLSAVLNDGSETALSWPQTISFQEASAVTLQWLPQPTALYEQANIYRQAGAAGPIQLVGSVASTVTSFTDTNQPVNQPTNGAPYTFYPAWNDPESAQYVASNLFSAFLHQNLTADPTNGISINALSYGYPFDDQGNWSTNINFGSDFPSSVTFQISTLT
jgi:hypothetical protein